MDGARSTSEPDDADGVDRLADADLAGSLSGGQVDAIVANLSDRVAGLWADHESALVPLLAEMSAVDTARMMIEWRAKADAIVDGPEPVDLLHRDDWDFVLDPDTNIVAVSRPGHPPRYGKPRPQPGTLLIGD